MADDFDKFMESEDYQKYLDNLERSNELRGKWFIPDLTEVENMDHLRGLIIRHMKSLKPDMTPEEARAYTDQINATQDDFTILQTFDTLQSELENRFEETIKKRVPTLEAAHGGIANINRLTRPLGY
jgi:hypothetical protein